MMMLLSMNPYKVYIVLYASPSPRLEMANPPILPKDSSPVPAGHCQRGDVLAGATSFIHDEALPQDGMVC